MKSEFDDEIRSVRELARELDEEIRRERERHWIWTPGLIPFVIGMAGAAAVIYAKSLMS
ncbi:hypothetical protein SFA35_21990 [Pseudomonas sp. HR96]|uniref:hypothetical protein n=1 Tax=Pseudomonas sp. HR96 TaxID=1027966 RepID=UPI002A7630E9|nr:hypothetical protein [Pseudomonas sp. HR96]WPO99245.1 hypothetical protein SFA35_21990 [Pseudomonas sp. HR96]